MFVSNRHHFLSNIHQLLEEEEKSNQTVSWAEALVGEVIPIHGLTPSSPVASCWLHPLNDCILSLPSFPWPYPVAI